jgi:hypothetical protein
MAQKSPLETKTYKILVLQVGELTTASLVEQLQSYPVEVSLARNVTEARQLCQLQQDFEALIIMVCSQNATEAEVYFVKEYTGVFKRRPRIICAAHWGDRELFRAAGCNHELDHSSALDQYILDLLGLKKS